MDHLFVNFSSGLALDYKVELEQAFYDQNFALNQVYYNEFDVSLNAANYIAIDLIDINKIKALVNDISDKSHLVLWYRDIILMRLVLGQVKFNTSSNITFVLANENDSQAMHQAIEKIRVNLVFIASVFPIIYKTKDESYNAGAAKIIRQVRNIKESINQGSVYYSKYYTGVYKNAIQNMPILYDNISVNDINNNKNFKFKNKPAIIVASGPSLDKNINLLKTLQDKAYILACDASVSALHQHDIIPDFIGVFEWRRIVYDYFFNDKPLNSKTKLITHLTATNQVITHFSNQLVLFNSNSEKINEFFSKIIGRDVGAGWTGTSVAHYLLSAANRMGFSPIILIGQDLSMSVDGRSHVSGSEASVKVSVNDDDVEWIKGNYEDKVPTNIMWKNFLTSFERYIFEEKLNVINATEGGAYIDGTTLMPLDQALASFDSLDKDVMMQMLGAGIKIGNSIDLAEACKEIANLIKKYIDLSERVSLAKKKIGQGEKRILKGVNTTNQYNKLLEVIDFTVKEVFDYIQDFELLDFNYGTVVRKNNEKIQMMKNLDGTIDNIKYSFDVYLKTLDFLSSELELLISSMVANLADIIQKYEIDYDIDKDREFSYYSRKIDALS